MNKKRILIVDDDKDILRMLEFGLKKLGPDYEIFTAKDIYSAIDEIEGRRFDLILTDYMMPGMTGVDLARAARRMSPEAQVVLMTAYGTNKLRDTTDHLGFDGYLNKPFTMEQVRDVIREVGNNALPEEKVESSSPPPTPGESSSDVQSPVPDGEQPIEDHLERLQINASARGVLLINSEGSLVQVAGQIDAAKLEYVCALVASNFYSSAELSNLVDNKKVFGASFYEGDAYNLYVCDVNGKFLLAVIFDAKLRPGVIWFYAKQTALTLAPLLN